MMATLRMGDRFLYFVLLWCLCSYKVLLGGVGEAGLRVDDLLLASAFVLLLVRGDLRQVPRSAALRAYLWFLAVNLLSALWNGWRGRVPALYGLLFTARLAEYLLFYAMGWVLITRGAKLWRSFRWYFYALCVVVPLQTLGVLKVASQFGASRASGNTNGPYELAVVAALFLCVFGYQERKKLSTLAAVALLVMTASRITFIGTALDWLVRSVSRSRSKARALAMVAALLLAAVGVNAWVQSRPAASENPDSLDNRLKSSSSSLSVHEMKDLWDAVPVYSAEEDYYQGAFLDAGDFALATDNDTSGMIRAYRWASLVKSTVHHLDSMVIGLGPSFGSAAVDGYYVRVFIETGVAGLIAFLLFLRALLRPHDKINDAFREFVFIVLVTGCFIDIFASYKTMLLLWTWHGVNEACREMKGREINKRCA
jgi:hypothetical protein